jgi:hypothetical protein
MKFNSVLRKLLVENSRFKVLYDKMVLPSEKALEKNPKAKGLINFDILKQIIFADPKTKAPDNFDIEGASIADMEQVKIGEYTQWLLKYFVAPVLPEDIKSMDSKSEEFKKYIKEYKKLYLEDLFKLTERLEYYDRVKKYKEFPADKKDINKLNPNDLYDIFVNFKEPERKVKEKEKNEARKTREGFKHAGSDVVYEDGEWIILQISKDKGAAGKDAAIYYGGFKDVKNGETDWCTSSPNLNFYQTYITQGPLFVVFPQDDKGQVGNRTGLPFERYQFHFESNQFMDRKDHRLDEGDVAGFFNNRPVLKEFFKPYFIKSAGRQGKTQDPNQFEFIYSKNNRDLAGIALVLYGMDDLINNIPLTVSKIMIKSDTPIVINLPKDFGDKYQNLKSLVLKSCIDKLPDSIGNLKKLITLTISNNPGLKELPSTLINLRDTLDFINIQGSEQVKIPDNLKEIIQDQGKGFLYIN